MAWVFLFGTIGGKGSKGGSGRECSPKSNNKRVSPDFWCDDEGPLKKGDDGPDGDKGKDGTSEIKFKHLGVFALSVLSKSYPPSMIILERPAWVNLKTVQDPSP